MCQIVTLVLIMILREIKENDEICFWLIQTILVCLNISVLVYSVYLVLKDYKMYFRSLLLKYLSDGNSIKKSIFEQIEKEKMAKFRWMTIK